MARFIPEIKPEYFNNSYGEKSVYEALRSLNDEYTVFYSLSWVGVDGNQSIGEADFVIFHPMKGIAVIEVKSGEIDFKDGIWTQINTRTQFSKQIDPFGQARKSQFDLFERLRNAKLGFKLPMFCYCAWFPSIALSNDLILPPESPRQIILDINSLTNPEKSINDMFDYWSTIEPSSCSLVSIVRRSNGYFVSMSGTRSMPMPGSVERMA